LKEIEMKSFPTISEFTLHKNYFIGWNQKESMIEFYNIYVSLLLNLNIKRILNCYILRN